MTSCLLDGVLMCFLILGANCIKLKLALYRIDHSVADESESLRLLVNLVLWKIELHCIIEDQRDISAKGARVTHVEVCLRSLLHVFKAHRRLYDLSVARYEILDRVCKNEVFIFLRHVLNLFSYNSCAFLLAALGTMILEGVCAPQFEPSEDTRVLKDSVTFEVHALGAISASDHTLREVGCEFRFVLKFVLWPEAIADETVLLVLALLVARSAELEVLGPLVEPVLASLSRPTALALNASLASELIITGEVARKRKLGVWIKTFVMIGRVAPPADHELLRRNFASTS